MILPRTKFTLRYVKMYLVYLLYNKTTKKFYVGVTGDIIQRLREHKTGMNNSTSHCCESWELVYYECYNNKKDAYTREKKLKYHGNGIRLIKSRIENTLHDLV